MKSDRKTSGIAPWRVRETELVFDNRWARVRRDACELPDGRLVPDYYYWEGNDFAQVFALTDESRVVLVRQYKHAVKEIVLELPAGLISPQDEAPLAAARRELLEETGFEAGEWQALGRLNASSAKATTRAYPFLATRARRVAEPRPDENEQIEVVLATVPDLMDLISAGEIRDSNSIACSLLSLRALNRDISG
jgi:ADP-ribose pyrophosphatase